MFPMRVERVGGRFVARARQWSRSCLRELERLKVSVFSFGSFIRTPGFPFTTMASPVVTFPDLPPPSYYENVSYRSEWQKLSEEASNTNQTVLDAAWHGPHLVACTASGDIAIWHVPEQLDQLDEEDEEQDNDDSSSVQSFDARFKKRRALVYVYAVVRCLEKINPLIHRTYITFFRFTESESRMELYIPFRSVR
jgi:hypothetical protein